MTFLKKTYPKFRVCSRSFGLFLEKWPDFFVQKHQNSGVLSELLITFP